MMSSETASDHVTPAPPPPAPPEGRAGALKVGAHETYLDEPDLLVVRFVGDAEPEEGSQLARYHRERIAPGQSCYLLADLSQLEAFPSATRRAISEHARHVDYLETFVVGASVTLRVILGLFIAFLNAFNAGRQKVSFYTTEQEARAAIAAARRDRRGG